MQQVLSKQIGQYTYGVRQLGAKQGLQVAAKVARLVSPLFGPGPGAVGGEADPAAFMERLQGAIQSLDVADLLDLAETFAKFTDVSGGDFAGKAPRLDTIFDVHFAARYGELARWLAFCVEVNFTSFFDDLGISLPSVPLKAA